MLRERNVNMNLTPEQLEEEKKYLEEVMKVVKELYDKNSDSIDSQIDSIQELKKYIWDNISELDDMEVAGEMYNVNTNVGYANKRMTNFFGEIVKKYEGKRIAVVSHRRFNKILLVKLV